VLCGRPSRLMRALGGAVIAVAIVAVGGSGASGGQAAARLTWAAEVAAQVSPPQDGSSGGAPLAASLDASVRAAVVEALAGELQARYIFPDVAARMARDVTTRQANGEYDAIADPASFAALLTQQMRAISGDQHLGVEYGGAPVPVLGVAPGGPGPGGPEAIGPLINYGFARVERLPGNIGYLDLRAFIDTNAGSGETAAAAMGFLAHTDALIVDLRQNRGGFPTMIQLLASYLFGPEPVLLNTFYFREGDRSEEWWTLPDVPGGRYGEQKPVYVLTSVQTFSAGEEFAYDLQARGRATIVGEVSGGGANPGELVPLADGFAAFIPFGRAINPVTGTNWEGSGVQPDVAVPAAEALTTAHALALRRLLESGATTPEGAPSPVLEEAQRALADLAQGATSTAVPAPPAPPSPPQPPFRPD